MTQTILATGNRGFIGQNVFFTLCENSTYKVIGYDRKEGYELCDKKQLQKIFAEFKPSVVVHLASNVSMEQDKCVEDVQALVNLLQMCEQHKVKKLIFTSSAAVYGNHYPEIIPVNSYGLSKLQCEQWCKFYVQRGMDITILRLANIYGSRGNGVINKFIENIKNQKPIIMYGDGHQKRDYTHVDDISAIISAIIDNPQDSDVFNVCTQISSEIWDVISVLSQLTDNISMQKMSAPFDEIMNSSMVNSHLVEKYGYRNFITLQQGIERLWKETS